MAASADAHQVDMTIPAVRLDAPLRIDGVLDEDVYERTPAIGGFTQMEPDDGAPATQRTEMWLFFDRDQVVIAFRCFESNPERMVLNEMRRDLMTNIAQNERITWVFDTFHDRRNGVSFTVTPLGARLDLQLTDRQNNVDWNPIWDFATGRFDGGWVVEAAIPFKSLRYRPGRQQTWGLQVQRFNRWKNEIANLVPIPRALGMAGVFQTSIAATVVGLEAPPGSKNIEIKPYATVTNEVTADVGVDLKYGITQNLTADLTYHTDFAQVEADEQQINLTRFNLFFPEKREFFLENQGTFAFGGAATSAFGASAGDVPVLFYSRQIGLHDGRAVPIVAGGRLTGRVGRFTVGMLNVRTGDHDSADVSGTNFSVVRLRRDVLRRSAVGVIATHRSAGQRLPGDNAVYGVDGTFRFFEDVSINTYWARTRTPGLSGDDTSYRAQLDYAGDRYGLQLEQLAIGGNFNPETGFVRRADMRRSFALARFSPRPRSSRTIRRVFFTGSMAYIENGRRRVETRDWDGEFAIEFQNSDRLSLGYGGTYEFLPRPFRIARGVTLPVDGYAFESVRAGFNLGQQRMLSGNVSFEHGTFYSGQKTAFGVSRGRVKITSRLAIEPTYSINWVDLPEGSFNTHLVGSRVVLAMTPMMFVSTLLQYNSSANVVSANARLRWEYQPGSELFVVYNEDRDTLARRFPAVTNRAVVVKANRVFRF